MIPEPIRQVREFIDTDGNNNELITYMVDNRLLHRVDGPSCISVLNGDVELEVYYQGRNKHRDDGPAVIRYDTIVSELYHSYITNIMSVCLMH